MPKKSWPLGALNDGDWSYIRREGDVREELFHADANQERNLAGDPAAGPTLERMRRPEPTDGRAARARPVQSLTCSVTAFRRLPSSESDRNRLNPGCLPCVRWGKMARF